MEKLRGPRARRVLAGTAGAVALWAVVGFLVLPPVLRPVVERRLSGRLHRKVTLRSLSINPFSLSATLIGLDVKDLDGGPFFSFDRLYINAEASSVFRGGPVLSAITLVRPSVSLVRNRDGTYNAQDLLAGPATAGAKDEKPFRFSFNNIRLEGGSVNFDDHATRTKHEVRDLHVGIPFLSNIPSKVEITTQPVFEAKVNGAPFALHGSTKPFSETRETTLGVNIEDVDLPFYLAYVPADTPSKLTAGRLDAKLTFAFTQAPNGPPALLVSGSCALRKVAAAFGGSPLVAWDRLEAVLDSVDVFGRSARIRSLKLVGLEVWVRRASGGFNFADALAAPGTGKISSKVKEDGPGRTAPAAPFAVDVAEAAIERGAVYYDDSAVRPAFHALFADVTASLKGFTTEAKKPAALSFSAKTDAGETFRNTGTVSMTPLSAEGTFTVNGLQLARYTPFLEEFVPIAADGVLGIETGYRWSAGKDGNTTFSGLSAEVKSPRLRKRGESEPFFKAATIEMTGSSLDVARRTFVLGGLTSMDGSLAVVREKDGNADLMKLVPQAPAGAPPPSPPAPWDVLLKRVALRGYTVRIDDLGVGPPARYALTKTELILENFSSAEGWKGSLTARFGLDGTGAASAKGRVGFKPMFADLRVDVKGVDLVPIEAYVLQDLRLDLARGDVSAGGTLAIREDAAGKASVVYAGDAVVANVLATDSSTHLDFLGWEAFSATGMKAGYNPMFLEAKQVAFAGLACDLTIESDGTLNARKVMGRPEPGDEAEEAAAPETAPAPTPVPAAAEGARGAREPSAVMPVRIDELTLQGGRIGLADHFVKPGYSGTLGDLGGRVTGLSSVDGTVATLDLRGSLANHSPLQVSGTVNPLAASQFADVKATFRDIDLSSFTPYSGKYAGYAIAGGALTLEVAYKLENRKLTASNRFLVNQFDFGEKVESKDATKLPVRLAVSLLKDKDGVIDLDLPIEGSLDDPKFRIGKVIWKILGNLIAKAATAPFALLGKLLGGKGEEYSSVAFADGAASLDEAGRKKLDALARALHDRPALKLQATGRSSGEKDLEGLRSLRLERKIKAQKLLDLARKGGAPSSVDDVVVEAAEREAYLGKAYRKEKFPKPRTTLGFAKDLPAGEMEKLLLANEPLGEDDLRQLALARSEAIKAYLTGPGTVDAARVFVLEPGARAADAHETRSSRVDFSLE